LKICINSVGNERDSLLKKTEFPTKSPIDIEIKMNRLIVISFLIIKNLVSLRRGRKNRMGTTAAKALDACLIPKAPRYIHGTSRERIVNLPKKGITCCALKTITTIL